jgi:hypothetical protein
MKKKFEFLEININNFVAVFLASLNLELVVYFSFYFILAKIKSTHGYFLII